MIYYVLAVLRLHYEKLYIGKVKAQYLIHSAGTLIQEQGNLFQNSSHVCDVHRS